MSLNAQGRGMAHADIGRDYLCARCGFTGVALASFDYDARQNRSSGPNQPFHWRAAAEAEHLISLAACPRCGRRNARAIAWKVSSLLLLGAGLSGLLGWLFLPLLRLPTPVIGGCAAIITSLTIALPLFASLRKAKRDVSF